MGEITSKWVAPMSEPRSRKISVTAAATDMQVFIPPYMLDAGRCKAIIRRILITVVAAGARADVILWDEHLTNPQPNAKRGSNTVGIIPKIPVADNSTYEYIPQNDGTFIQYGAAVRIPVLAAGQVDIQIDYDLQM